MGTDPISEVTSAYVVNNSAESWGLPADRAARIQAVIGSTRFVFGTMWSENGEEKYELFEAPKIEIIEKKKDAPKRTSKCPDPDIQMPR